MPARTQLEGSHVNCYYCDKIQSTAPDYVSSPATRDLGSPNPRCDRHWRFSCVKCGEAAHFMASAYCAEAKQFFCSRCADATEQVGGDFWCWPYYFSYRSPWSGRDEPSLDRLEFEGRHPLQSSEASAHARVSISPEAYIERYPSKPVSWRVAEGVMDADVEASWTINAERWDALYDHDGDRNRRYQSDEPMLQMLGEVRDQRILDVGSGQGYLCRKLSTAGAAMTGIELSGGFFKIATEREEQQRLGIDYRQGSASAMTFFDDAQFDKAVSNYVMMDIPDYVAALGHIHRVLKPGGCFVVVISHPSFACGPAWERRPPDSPRREERIYVVDNYFRRGPYKGQWGSLDPVLSFHRPLRDYWRAFRNAGFEIDEFEEPSITGRGRHELPPGIVDQALRIPYSCIFRLVRPA